MVLATEYQVDEDDAEDGPCECFVDTIQVDGVRVEVHHIIPDDFAAHAPTSECGCKPVLHTRPRMLVYEHLDQDPGEPWPG